MLVLPQAAEPLVSRARALFTRPSFERFVLMSVGAIVTFGRRSVSRILRVVGAAARGIPAATTGYFRGRDGASGRWLACWRRRCWNWFPAISRCPVRWTTT